MKLTIETISQDLSGQTLFPSLYPEIVDFNTIISSDEYLVSPLNVDTTTQAYMQVSDGADSDIDTFFMELDSGDTYRIIFSSENTDRFLSNRQMTVFESSGRFIDLILNDYGDTFSTSDTLTTSTFTARQSGDYLLFSSFAHRNGPVTTPYALTLEKVVDVTPWNISLTRSGMGARAVVTSGDEIIAAGTQIAISLTFATSNVKFDDVNTLVFGSVSTSVSSTNTSTTISIFMAAPETIFGRNLLEVSFSGGGNAGSLEVSYASIRVAGASTFVDIGDAVFTPGDMVLVGTARDDVLSGDIGDDRILGRAGDDTLIGGAGRDTLNGGTGSDLMLGGAGDDTYFVDASGDVVREFARRGNDTVQSSISYALGDDVENLTLLGVDAIDGVGNGLANRITGNAGDNTLTGMAGNDTISGGAGKDTISGGTGDDRLDGGAGSDSMWGGAGDDIYFVDAWGDAVREFARQGVDTVQSVIGHTLAGNVEKLTLLGTDDINGAGNGLANAITGNAGDNTLKGMAGKDTLSGDAGDDRLEGGAGADRLTGGTGADRFVLATLSDSTVRAAGRDTITDFSLAQHDLIHLGAIDANVLRGGNQSFRFLGDAAFTGQAGELSARIVTGGAMISGDVNGDRIADFALRLDDKIALGGDSFIL